MAGPFRRARRRVTPLLVICLVLLTTIYITLPPDSAVVLATTFNYARVRAALGLSRGDGWLRSAVRYPVHLPSEVGWLIKTGYGTRTRVRDQLDAFAAKGGVLGDEGRDYLVVGDWDGRNASVRVVDAVGLVLDDERMSGVADHARFAKYRSLRAAVEAGDEERAAELGRKFGWELDALKVSRLFLCSGGLMRVLTLCSNSSLWAWNCPTSGCRTRSGTSFWTTTRLWSRSRWSCCSAT
jgi:hypothetical protein